MIATAALFVFKITAGTVIAMMAFTAIIFALGAIFG